MGCLILFLLIASGTECLSQQTDIDKFIARKDALSKEGMLVLGAWAGTNFVLSGYGWATTKGKEQYFHAMNVGWNVINMPIAIGGYRGTVKRAGKTYNKDEALRSQRATETVYLVNSCLDVFYMASGIALIAIAPGRKYESMLRGFGESFVIQGAFLFGFDVTSMIIHKRHRKRDLTPLLSNVHIGPTSARVVIPIGR